MKRPSRKTQRFAAGRGLVHFSAGRCLSRTDDGRKHGPVPLAPPRRSPRRGISLLEVLISALIISVGIIGVMTLLPLGHYEVNEGTLADRSALVGKQAFRDFRIRQMNMTHSGQEYTSEDNPLFTWIPTLTAVANTDRYKLTITMYFMHNSPKHSESVATYNKTIRLDDSGRWNPGLIGS